MSIARNAIVALEKAQVPIYRETVSRTIEAIKRSKLGVRDILKHFELVTKEAKEMVQKEVSMQRPQVNMLTLDTQAMSEFIMSR